MNRSLESIGVAVVFPTETPIPSTRPLKDGRNTQD